MKNSFRLICILLCVVFLISACANTGDTSTMQPEPSAQMQQPEAAVSTDDSRETSAAQAAPTDEQSGTKWIVSEIAGNVTADMELSPQDDFHASMNQEWLAEDHLGGAMQASTFSERAQEVQNQVIGLIGDETQTSHEAKLVQKFYNDYMDMDARNALGMEPVIPMIERIQEIETLDDLTAYLTADDGKLAGPPLSIEVAPDWKDSTRNMVAIETPSFSLSDADEYESLTEVGKRKKAAMEVKLQKLLARVGYTDEEAAGIIEAFFGMEGKIAAVSMGEAEFLDDNWKESAYNIMTAEELAKLSPDFPITDFLKPYTDAGVDRFMLMEPEWLAGMNEIYTEENVEEFKAWLLCRTLDAAAMFLDQECLDAALEYTGSAIAGGAVEPPPPEQLGYDLCNSTLDMAVGRMYAENYVTPETKQSITEMVDEAVAVFRKRLENNDWLGEETRANAIEKLDSMKIRVAYPDDWSLYDYSDLSFPEGGGIFDDLLAVRQRNQHLGVKKANSPVDANVWPKPPQDVNAYYSANDNSINIPAGILGGDFYDAESSVEEQMGGIGTMVIGHEITHGFDSQGSAFDKDGNLRNWWMEEDRAAFRERTDKVAAYFGSIETLPELYVDGNLTVTESVADLGGMSCMLEIAKGIEDFDYEAFFSAFAKIWKTQEAPETFEYALQMDEHPPGYVRTNATVQQFQEFYDAYGVTEGDGMYIAPEDRLAVW